MKLLLTSTGFPNQAIKNKFLQLVGKDPKEIKVAFIPTAADPYEDKWFIRATIDEVNEMRMKLVLIDLKGENEQGLKEKLAECDVIYVGGGNTFYLLDWVRKSGFNRAIKDLLNQGKVYIGGSAGSVLVGPDISIASWGPSGDKNEVSLKDLSSLSLVPFTVLPHFTEEEREIIESKMGELDYPIIAITNDQAVLIDGKRQKIIGKGKKIVLHKK